ncbi:MAG: nucleotide exchange factor GrpE [Oscillospiraceae bacterium]|nr:nucleotide exchange factor GrpE [Oscillospiraceae bacterium]
MIPIKDKEEKKAPKKDVSEKTERETLKEEEIKEAEQAAEETAPDKQEVSEETPAEEKKPEEKSVSEEMALLNDKYLRICAEYDNYRKRTQKEKDNLYGDIRANVITSFLPVYDNLVRALAAETADDAYRKGVELIMNQFNATLEKLGATEIKAVGEKFDPAVHNAVMHVDDETKGENEVVEEFQKGFKLGDKVIRFSMVKVAN